MRTYCRNRFARPAAQRVASRRTAQRRDLLQLGGGQSADQGMAAAL